MFPSFVRYFNKYVLNPIMRRTAGSRGSKFAIMRHVGRRSGKSFETPIIVAPEGRDFIIALTYGPNVDWYRNVTAAEHGTLIWQGKTIAIGKPEPINPASGIQAFSALERFVLRRINLQYFVRVKPIAA